MKETLEKVIANNNNGVFLLDPPPKDFLSLNTPQKG